MKKITLLFIHLVAVSIAINAQEEPKKTLFKKVKDKTKETTEQRVEGVGDKVGNKIGDKVDNAVDGVLSGKWLKKKKKKDKSGKKDNEEDATKNDENETNKVGVNKTNDSDDNSSKSKLFTVYKKFDFIPGEKVTAYEDFSNDNIGEFPAKWNTNSSGEIVDINGDGSYKWIQFAKNGIYYPEFVNELPDNFTIEFDMAVTENFSEMMSGLKVFFTPITNRNLMFDQHFDTKPGVAFDVHPVENNTEGNNGISMIWGYGINDNKILENTTKIMNWKNGDVNKISIWRQKQRLRVYINEAKVWDIPKAFENNIKYSFLFATDIWEGNIYLTELRVAEGLPDTRNKLLTEGKFVTNGILFEFQKSDLKPESYAVIKEIADVLKENPAIKISIIGHTSNDGDHSANIILSKQRAETVQNFLVKEFNIDINRMVTMGKGGTEPIDTSNTTLGKANNRRVEFIKL